MLIRSVLEEMEVDEQYLPPIGSQVDLDLSQQAAWGVINLYFWSISGESWEDRYCWTWHYCERRCFVRRLSYRIPERLLTSLKNEIDLMLSLRIIKTSKNEWCNPAVLVPKKDGSMRCSALTSSTWIPFLSLILTQHPELMTCLNSWVGLNAWPQ